MKIRQRYYSWQRLVLAYSLFFIVSSFSVWVVVSLVLFTLVLPLLSCSTSSRVCFNQAILCSVITAIAPVIFFFFLTKQSISFLLKMTSSSLLNSLVIQMLRLSSRSLVLSHSLSISFCLHFWRCNNNNNNNDLWSEVNTTCTDCCPYLHFRSISSQLLRYGISLSLPCTLLTLSPLHFWKRLWHFSVVRMILY